MTFSIAIRLSTWGLVFLAPAIAAAQQVQSSVLEDVRVVPLPKQTYGYRGMPGSIVELKDGRLLLSYSRMMPDGQADGSIAGRYSSDKGKSWADEFVLVPKPKPLAADRYCHPSFLRLANSDILLSYIYVSGAKPLFGHNYYRCSVDDGQTWGDQLIVTPHRGYNIIHNDKFLQIGRAHV